MGRRTDAGHGDTLGDGLVADEVEAEDVVAHRHDQPLDEAGQRDQQTDRADDPGVHRGLGEPPEQDPVEEQAEQRGEQEHRDDERRDDGHAEPGVQLVVEVRGGERDRPVREVEDARRGEVSTSPDARIE